VVVVHDVVAVRHPEWHGRGYAAWQRWLLPRLARRALQVVTVSEFSRREIVDALGVPAERVATVPRGARARFRPGREPDAGGRPATRDSASPAWRRWPAGRPSWRRPPAPCPRPAATPRGWSTPTTRKASPPRWWSWRPAAPSTTACGRRGSPAPANSRGSAPPR